MKINIGSYVVFTYKLAQQDGTDLPSREEGKPIAFIVGQGHMFGALERQLLGMEAGEIATVFLEPKETFGEYDQNAVKEIPRTEFPENVELSEGMAFRANGPSGPTAFVIKSFNDDVVTVDMNHPLAGQRLRCEVHVIEVREPSEDELAGPGQDVNPFE